MIFPFILAAGFVLLIVFDWFAAEIGECISYIGKRLTKWGKTPYT